MMTASAIVYAVPACHLAGLQERIAKLNRRAAKLGVQTITLTVGEAYSVKVHNDLGFDYERIMHDCSLDLPSVALEGWTLVAAIEPQETGEKIVRTVPGESCPEQYRAAGMHCDHCNTDRRRSEVFIVRHEATGEHKQVGRQCIADFLGHDATRFLALAALVRSFDELGHEAEEGFGGGWVPDTIDASHFLTMVAVIMRRLGWISRGKAQPGQRPTADLAWSYCLPPRHMGRQEKEEREMLRDAVTPDTVKLAADALAWAQSQPMNASDYLYNLGVAARVGYVTYKTCGIVGSAVAAYARAMEQQLAKPAPNKQTSKHQGTVGQRQVFKALTVTGLTTFESMYGVRTLIRFKDGEGNVLCWFTGEAPQWAEQGATVDVRGTVKGWDEYRGVQQTTLTRVALV